MLAVTVCGEWFVMQLESLGIERLADLRGLDTPDPTYKVG